MSGGKGRPPLIFIGVDACRKGWLGVLGLWEGKVFKQEEVIIASSIREFLALDFKLLAIDIPIGIPEDYEPGGRLCDRWARKLLGPRSRSVFSPPPRKVWQAASYTQARALLHGHLSLQSWNILPKIKEVDKVVSPLRQRRIRETHPELVFYHLAQGPLPSKHLPHGQRRRLDLLNQAGIFGSLLQNYASLPRGLRVDLLDAYAALLAAKRISGKEASCIPPEPGLDPRGLRMEICF